MYYSFGDNLVYTTFLERVVEVLWSFISKISLTQVFLA